MPEITVPCATCSGTGWATHENRHTETRQDQCRACGGTGQVPARPGESRETSWPWAVPGVEVRTGMVLIPTKPASVETAIARAICRGENSDPTCPRLAHDGYACAECAGEAKKIREEIESVAVLAVWTAPSDAITQARRLAADEAEERFRGDRAALFMSGAGDDHPWVQTALRGLRAARGASYQDRVYRHFRYVAGDDPTDVPERRDRAAEEHAELQQALGQTLEGYIAIGRYVWGRPAGEPGQEMGGTLNTLAALAAWAGLDMMACAEAELARTMRPEIVAKIRHKRANRHGRGVLPGDDADLVTSAGEAGQ